MHLCLVEDIPELKKSKDVEEKLFKKCIKFKVPFQHSQTCMADEFRLICSELECNCLTGDCHKDEYRDPALRAEDSLYDRGIESSRPFQ
mmetsp:Transcript_31476/g.35954  ORF Transcript_31476/g.35954 Transcript_31476/m.35954 type:complete len:89 (+) Transcript_31476:219-485(+)